MKYIFTHIVVIVVVLFSYSCKTSKRMVSTAPSVDTANMIVVNVNAKQEELVWLKEQLNILHDKNSHIQTVSAKLSLNIESSSSDLNQSANAILRMEKNKKIWLSINGPLSIEVARLLITPDSLILLNKLKGTVLKRDILFLEQLIAFPMSFYDFQDWLLGNTVLANGVLDAYAKDNDEWQVKLTSALIQNVVFFTASKDSLPVLNNSQIIDKEHNKSCHLEYKKYMNIQDVYFPLERLMFIRQKDEQTNISLSFTNILFNTSLTFPFKISESYSEE